MSENNHKLLWVTRYGWVVCPALSFSLVLFRSYLYLGHLHSDNLYFLAYCFVIPFIVLCVISLALYGVSKVIRIYAEIQVVLFTIQLMFALFVGYWLSGAVRF